MTDDNNFYKDGIFYIHGEFDETISRNIMPELDKFIRDNKDKVSNKPAIIFNINSVGGDTDRLFCLLSTIDYAKSLRFTIKTIVTGRALSCGSKLAIYGTKGHRYIGKYSHHQIHYGSYRSNSLIHPKEVDRFAEYTKNHFKAIYNFYKDNSNIPNLEKVLEHDEQTFSAQECIQYGLADKIIGE